MLLGNLVLMKAYTCQNVGSYTCYIIEHALDSASRTVCSTLQPPISFTKRMYFRSDMVLVGPGSGAPKCFCSHTHTECLFMRPAMRG